MATKYIKGHVYATSWPTAKKKAERKLGSRIHKDSLVVKKARGIPKRNKSSAYSYIAQRR